MVINIYLVLVSKVYNKRQWLWNMRFCSCVSDVWNWLSAQCYSLSQHSNCNAPPHPEAAPFHRMLQIVHKLQILREILPRYLSFALLLDISTPAIWPVSLTFAHCRRSKNTWNHRKATKVRFPSKLPHHSTSSSVLPSVSLGKVVVRKSSWLGDSWAPQA